MDLTHWANIGQILEGAVAVLALLGGAAWTFFHFRKRKEHRGKATVGVGYKDFGIFLDNDGIQFRMIELLASVSNAGPLREYIERLDWQVVADASKNIVIEHDGKTGEIKPSTVVRLGAWIESSTDIDFVDSGLSQGYVKLIHIPAQYAILRLEVGLKCKGRPERHTSNRYICFRDACPQVSRKQNGVVITKPFDMSNIITTPR